MKRLLILAALFASLAFGQSPSARFFVFDTVPDAADETTETKSLILTDGSYPSKFTVQAMATGAPTTCTYKLQGTLDTAPSGTDWVDLTTAKSCLTSNDERMHHVLDKPVHLIRVYLVSLAGGTAPTVPFSLLATR